MQRIQANEPGYAFCRIGGQIVLFIKGDDPVGYFEHASPVGYNSAGKLLQAMILDIAEGDGAASRETFYRSTIDHMIASRRAFPSDFKREHREARDLADYLESNPNVFV